MKGFGGFRCGAAMGMTAITICMLVGCGDTGSAGQRTTEKQNAVDQLIEQSTADATAETANNGSTTATDATTATDVSGASDTTAYDAGATTAAPAGDAAVTDVDVDLTVLSSTMVYSEVLNMISIPDNYKGKSVRMRGTFAHTTDPNTGKDYYACIIQDATACCSSGLEFELEGEYTFPDDYPPVDTEITVVGTYDTYFEGQFEYCTLRNAHME